MTKKEKEYLLKLSRRTLEKYLKEKSILSIDEEDLKYPILKEKRGVFVTLLKNGELRGCIGNLMADKPVYQAIIENTLAAALFDPRFPPVEEEELKDIKIEISLLSNLQPVKEFKDLDSLFSYLKKRKPGLFIQKNSKGATFLPQVWEDLKNPEEFLSHLCLKAGLKEDSYKDKNLIMLEYQVEKVQEENKNG